MKLITFTRRGSTAEELGLMRGEGVLPLREAGFSYADMNDLICRSSKEDLAAMAAAEGAELALDEITLLSPIPRPLQDVLCLGLNYAAHAQEASGFSRDAFGVELAAPIFFSKRVNYSQGSGAPIPAHRDLTVQLDFENELAVIIGRDADHVAEAEVRDHIFGYTILNDVSAREVQTRHKQWHFGKSLEGFCPMGPCIVTADEFSYPPGDRQRAVAGLHAARRHDHRHRHAQGRAHGRRRWPLPAAGRRGRLRDRGHRRAAEHGRISGTRSGARSGIAPGLFPCAGGL